MVKRNEIINFFKKRNGYAKYKDFKEHKIHSREIARLLQEGLIEKVQSGLYRLKSFEITEQQYFIELGMMMPKAVVCLYSALAYYDLTTFVPTKLMLAVPKHYKVPKIEYPPTQFFYFSPKLYEAGLEEIVTKNGVFKIYSVEKSICDAFRFRRRLGMDSALEALFAYLKKRNRKLPQLIQHAKLCRVYNIMKPYIEARLT